MLSASHSRDHLRTVPPRRAIFPLRVELRFNRSIYICVLEFCSCAGIRKGEAGFFSVINAQRESHH